MNPTTPSLRKWASALMFCALLLSGVNAIAQGNLQYNRVLLVTTVQTVPSGRVWKVESIGSSNGDMLSASSNGPRITVNGTNIFLVNYSNMATSSNTFFPSMLPMWLPANTTLAAGTGTGWVSVVEFLIVP